MCVHATVVVGSKKGKVRERDGKSGERFTLFAVPVATSLTVSRLSDESEGWETGKVR